MPRDPRNYITVHDGLPEHPKVEPLSDAAFRLLITIWLGSREGFTRQRRGKAYAELIDAGMVGIDGELLEWGVLFRGPFRERSSRPKIPPTVRARVYLRDGYACVRCLSSEDLSLDHIYPWSLGGDNSEDNLQTMCMPCNLRKGARVDDLVQGR